MGRLRPGVDFPEAKQRQFAAVAAALGLSLQQTLALSAIVLPAAGCPSRATLGRWVREAAARAGRVLPVLDAACRPSVSKLCLDEIFCRRRPLLIGVEPHSLARLLGRRAPDRTGETWCRALLPWSRLDDAVVDGGSGLRRGLELVQQAWRQAAPLLPQPLWDWKRLYWNCRHFAEAIGVGQPAISMMLARDCRPQRRTVEKIAQALKVPAEYLWPGFEGD